jgi:hypothetical protein
MLKARLIPHKILILPPVSRVKLVPGRNANLAFGVPLLVFHSFFKFSRIAGFEDYLAAEREAVSVELFFPQTIPITFAIDEFGIVVDAPARGCIRPITRWQSRCNKTSNCTSDDKLISSLYNTVVLRHSKGRRFMNEAHTPCGIDELRGIVRIYLLNFPLAYEILHTFDYSGVCPTVQWASHDNTGVQVFDDQTFFFTVETHGAIRSRVQVVERDDFVPFFKNVFECPSS